MKTLIALLVLTIFVLFYILHGRTWLRSQPWAAGFMAWIEPIEIALWRKSETVLFARWLQFVGLLIPLLETIGAVDLSPFLQLIPEGYRVWLVAGVALAGILVEFLRRYTTKPLELVEIPETKVPPAVATAVAKAEAAKETAVAKVEEAQAKGTM